MSSTTSTSTSNPGTGIGANSILSEKVSRALQVPTETPAMKAALDALANLSTTSNSNHHEEETKTNQTTKTKTEESKSKTNNREKQHVSIDARSVRAAIERDALYQARLLQGELRKLVGNVQTLRGEIRGVADVAEEVCRSIDKGVVARLPSVSGIGGSGGGSGGANGGGRVNEEMEGEEKEHRNEDEEEDTEQPNEPDGVTTTTTATTTTNESQDEQRLASLLATAFHERSEASKRYHAISIFVQKFNLSENDSYLLDHYDFDDAFCEEVGMTTTGRRGGTPSSSSTREDENGRDREDSTASPPRGGGGGGATSTTGGEKNGTRFLNALIRVQRIRKELATSFHNTSSSSSSSSSSSPSSSHLGATSAIRMMEALAAKQERAYERLYRFLHDRLDLGSASVAHVPTSSTLSVPQRRRYPGGNGGITNDDEEEDGMDVTLAHPFVRRSLAVLRSKPAYYTHTLELVATVRRSEVTRRFLMALTSGYGGMAAMEMKAHDPVNYVGDMLAFVFRALSVESVLSSGLAGSGGSGGDGTEEIGLDEDDHKEQNEEGGGRTSSVLGMEEEEEDEGPDVVQPMSAIDVLNDTMSGVARPLRSRIAQVIGALARRPEEYDDDGTGIGGGRTGREADGAVDDPNLLRFEEESGSARVRLASIYSVCGLLLYYHSAVKKAVNKLVPFPPPSKRSTSSHKDGSDDDDDDNDPNNDRTSLADSDHPSNRNPVVRCLVECIEEASRAYVASLRVHVVSLPHYASSSSSSSAELARDVVERLCQVRSASPGFDEEIVAAVATTTTASSASSDPGMGNGGGGDGLSVARCLSLEYLCDVVIDGVLSTMDDPSSLSLPTSSTSDDRLARAQIDDLGSIKTAIVVARKAGLDPTVVAKWDAIVRSREEVAVERLVLVDTADALEECGLGPVLRASRELKAMPTEGGGLDREVVMGAIERFYGSLSDLPFPSYEAIKDPVLRKYARTKLVKNVGDAYGEVYGVVLAEGASFGDSSFLEHTPQAVAALLSS